jgi:hypothetical protein
MYLNQRINLSIAFAIRSFAMTGLSWSTYESQSTLPVDNVDWFQIECAYRYGNKPLEKIGIEHGISLDLIRKKAEQDSWPQPMTDLAAYA